MNRLRRREGRLPAALAARRRRVARIRPGTLPGTLEAPESVAGEAARISVLAYGPDALVERRVGSVDEALAERGAARVTWVNVDGLGQPEVLARLGDAVGLHPMALEDAMSVPHRPEVERFDTYFFVVLRMVRHGPAVEEAQVSLFFGRDWVLTVQERADDDVFTPLTFIASIYGMNFEWMAEVKWRYGYPAALGRMAATAAAMLLYFRRRGWW